MKEKPIKSNIFDVIPAPADIPRNVLQKNIERVRGGCREADGGLIEVGMADLFINWCRKNSLWYLFYATACCGIEMMQGGASKYDFDRFGAVFRATPRQADMMLVCGTITHKMAERVQRLYAQMAEPKWVIAIGACAISGGPFYKDSYHVVKGVDLILPKVDVYVPGCPPRPEAFIEGIRNLQKLIIKTKNFG